MKEGKKGKKRNLKKRRTIVSVSNEKKDKGGDKLGSEGGEWFRRSKTFTKIEVLGNFFSPKKKEKFLSFCSFH